MRDGLYYHLALGGTKGKLVILDEETLKPVWETKDSLQVRPRRRTTCDLHVCRGSGN